MDPDDLLADAIEGLLVRWADGGEEIASPRGYLLVSMRNRVINETRAPRSRSAHLGAGFDREDRSALATDATVELDHELAWLRIAIGRLSEAHRGVLGDEALGTGGTTGAARTADARHSRRARARRALRRAYLQVVLEEGAAPACHTAIAELPARVGDSPEATSEAPEHFGPCRRCRGRWAVFAGLAGGLGIAGAVVVPSSGAPASALDVRGDGAEAPGGAGFASRGAIASGAAMIGTGILLAAAALLPGTLRPWVTEGADPGSGTAVIAAPGRVSPAASSRARASASSAARAARNRSRSSAPTVLCDVFPPLFLRRSPGTGPPV